MAKIVRIMNFLNFQIDFAQISQHHGLMNKKVSQGILSFSNGDKYEGDLVNNKKHGHGVYTYKNGDVYDGEWLSFFFFD